MITSDQFYKNIRTDIVNYLRQNPTSQFKIGTVKTATGRPTITFDGESTPSVKQYPYLSSYTPNIGDRVLLAVVGSSYVVLGKII